MTTRQEQDIATAKIGFDHGWDAALDEAIVILETAVLKEWSAVETLQALRDFRDANHG